jgi:sugar O-acyltransferase (sialic acid O-acetyltransferase NeuD family)
MADPGWIIYACRTSFAVEVAEAIWRRGEEVALLVDNLEGGGDPQAAADPPAAEIDAPVVRPAELSPKQRDLSAVVPLITPGHRFAVEAEARGLGVTSFPALVDPTAVVARTTTVGEGSVVNAAAVLGAATTLGRFVHVNRSASVGHHNVIEDYATLGPGCLLAGSVRIGRGAFVGAGAVCAPEVGIGPDALVGAGAVVVRDVPAAAVVVGNPARVVREGGGGYGGVRVPEALP